MAIDENIHNTYMNKVVCLIDNLLKRKEKEHTCTQEVLRVQWAELLCVDQHVYLIQIKTRLDMDDFAFFSLLLVITLEVSYHTQEACKRIYGTSYATFFLASALYREIHNISFQDTLMVIQETQCNLLYAYDFKQEDSMYQRKLRLQPWILSYSFYGGVMQCRYVSFVYVEKEIHMSGEECTSFLNYAKQGMKAILTLNDEIQLLETLNGMEMTVCMIDLAHVPLLWNVNTLFSFCSFYAQILCCTFFIRHDDKDQKKYLKNSLKKFPFTFLITNEALLPSDIPILHMPYTLEAGVVTANTIFVKEYSFQKELPDFIGDANFLNRLDEFMNMAKHKEEIHQLISSDTATKGISALFYGPSGNGKTLSARYIAKRLEKPLWQVELSNVLDKYIGESEKHLETIFHEAEKKDVILLFDEADTLFTKRTNVQDANDRYANAVTSYLLQRMESFPGIMILTSNFLHNFDDAFLRRIHCILRFSEASKEQRLHKWHSITKHMKVEESLDWDDIASIKLSYARIDQCLFMACSFMVSQNLSCLCEHHIKKAIVYELEKHGELPPKGWCL